MRSPIPNASVGSRRLSFPTSRPHPAATPRKGSKFLAVRTQGWLGHRSDCSTLTAGCRARPYRIAAPGLSELGSRHRFGDLSQECRIPADDTKLAVQSTASDAFYRAALPLSRQTLPYVASVIRRHPPGSGRAGESRASASRPCSSWRTCEGETLGPRVRHGHRYGLATCHRDRAAPRGMPRSWACACRNSGHVMRPGDIR
jgi:hypothetical protein